ncbi:MAG: universal stress protein [Candidatus Brocadiales bacterium]
MMITLQSILCPIDHSKHSESALKYAITFALKDKAKLYLMHVLDSRVREEAEGVAELTSIDEKGLNDLKDKLEKSVPEEIRAEIECEALVCPGIPFDEIVKAAKDKSIDLIVMGTHGRKNIKQVILGSIAEKVVRDAPCPVMIVKYQETQDR